MESAVQEYSGNVGTVLVPMRFVWPYGGKNVSLSGSFNRWSELIPMSPVEGCPTVFQVVVSLPLGCHQYKFSVDEQWKHDELQPCVSTEYGIVNTIFLPPEPNHLPPSHISPVAVDVNNQCFGHLRLPGAVSTGIDSGANSLEAKVVASRQQVSVFLSTKTAFELLPESGKVVALDIEMPIKQAFHIFYEQGISTAPLWDFSKGQFIGVLSAMDFILILDELGNHGSNLTEEELETHTIFAWKEGKAYMKRQVDGNGRAFSRPVVHAGPNDNLKDVALKILQNEVASIPIINPLTEDGLYPQLLHMASLSGILKCICRYFRNCPSLLPVLQLPICAIPVGTWVSQVGESNQRPLVMLRPSASLSMALNMFIQAQVSSIPIVDETDSLLDIYARSDVMSLAKDKVYTRINLNEMTLLTALQLVQDSCSLYEPNQRCQMCLRSDSLHKVMERLATPGVRRIVIVEAGSRRVEGIISLSDIFKFMLG